MGRDRVEVEGIENLSSELKEAVLKLKEYLDSRPLTREAVLLALTGKEGVKQAEELLSASTKLYQQAERLSLVLERFERLVSEGKLPDYSRDNGEILNLLKELKESLGNLNVDVNCLSPDLTVEVKERGERVEKPLIDLLRETYYAVNTLVYTDKDGKKYTFGELVDYLGNLAETTSYYLSSTDILLNELYSELPKVKYLVYTALALQLFTFLAVLFLFFR